MSRYHRLQVVPSLANGMEWNVLVLYSMHVQQNKPSSFVPSYLIFFFLLLLLFRFIY